MQDLARSRAGLCRAARVALAADGRLATGPQDSTAKIWSADDAAGLATLKGHRDSVASVAFATDGRLATGPHGNTADLSGGRSRSRSRAKLLSELAWLEELQAACRSFGPPQAVSPGPRQQDTTGAVGAELPAEQKQFAEFAQSSLSDDGGAGASSSEKHAASLAACLAACRAPLLQRTAPAAVAAQHPHRLFVSGVVTWCKVCGAYGDARLRGLLQACPGPIRGRSESGRAAALRHLRNGRHPKTQEPLPRAVPLR